MYLSNPRAQADWKIDRYCVGLWTEHVRRMHDYEPEMALWAAVIELAVADVRLVKTWRYSSRDKTNHDTGEAFLATLQPGDLIYECALALA